MIPSVALCIPAYNAGRFLPRLLAAARAQTIPFDDVWVFDDASADNTSAITKEFGAKVITAAQNSGCSFGKNTLAECTSCDWIHFHDADDSLLPGFVVHARECIQRHGGEADVILLAYEMREEGTDRSLGARKFDDASLRQDALRYAIQEQINPFCGLYRRSTFLAAGGYDTDPLVLYNEDVAFHIRLALRGLKFRADDQVQIVNYCRADSMSSTNKAKCARAQFHVMRKLVEELASERRLSSYSEPIASRLWDIATFAASFCDWEYVDRCIELAHQLGSRRPARGSARFQFLTKLSPRVAYRVRENLIRFFRPALRVGYPSI
jgi:glycosyltransferase involved in cell wall biosynthesis